MMHLSAKTFSSASEIMANAQAVHSRIWGMPKRVNIAFKPPVLIEEPALEEAEFDLLEHYKAITIRAKDDEPEPLWKSEPTYFDAHVVENRLRGSAFVSVWLKKRAIELGTSAATVKSQSRTRLAVSMRHRLIIEAFERYPGFSLPQLGKIFGGRDHTTILYVLQKAGLKTKRAKA